MASHIFKISVLFVPTAVEEQEKKRHGGMHCTGHGAKQTEGTVMPSLPEILPRRCSSLVLTTALSPLNNLISRRPRIGRTQGGGRKRSTERQHKFSADTGELPFQIRDHGHGQCDSLGGFVWFTLRTCHRYLGIRGSTPMTTQNT